MIIAIVLVLIVVGSVAFHMLSPWWWTPIASNWGYIDTTLIITFWITGIVFVMVILFLAYCVFAFRHREGHKAIFDPENKRLEIILTVLTTIGVAALLVPGLFVWKQFVTVPDDAIEVEVFAQQWRWSYRLPGEDGRLGTSAAELINDDNPLGINPYDRFGKDDVIVDGGDLYLEMGQPVKMVLRSIDVLHNYYVPEFRAKMDMVPGMVTYYWFTPTRVGDFEVLCAEYCGTAHGYMRGDVYVVGPEDYQVWLQEQETFADYAAAAEAKHDTQIAQNRQP